MTSLFETRLPKSGLFAELRADAAMEWEAYTRHDFVQGMADGTLPEAAFRHYLVQDYLFLIHFARAYSLAVYKSDNLPDMRAAAAIVSGILDTEMSLHIEYSAKWGITEEEMAAVPEDPACMAYTRYVLERGMAGDVLDLYVALSPCVVGYAEIGSRLASDPNTKMQDNPYASWIEMYSGEEYIDVAVGAAGQLDRLGQARGSDARMDDLKKTFRAATILERDFWQMGLNAAGNT